MMTALVLLRDEMQGGACSECLDLRKAEAERVLGSNASYQELNQRLLAPNLLNNSLQRSEGGRALGNGPPDHQIVTAGLQGLGRRHNTFLVPAFGISGANPRGHQQKIFT